MFVATLMLAVLPSLQDTTTAQRLPSVRVTGASPAGGRVPHATRAAMRTPTPLREVPQSVTVLTGPVLRELGLNTMAQSVEFLPGITMGQGEGHRDAPTIRGQSTTADFFIDGVRDDAQYYRDTYNVDALEAITGANALAFGRGGGGGVINRVSKQALRVPVRELRATAGSYAERRVTADLGRAIAGHFAARLNALHERSESFRDALSLEKGGVSPAFSYQAGRTLVQAGGEFYRDRRAVDRGIPSFNGAPSAAPINRFFGDTDANHAEIDVTSGFVIAEQQLARGVTVRSQSRAVAYDKFYRNVYPNGAVRPGSDGMQVSLAAYNSATDRHNLFNQTDVTWTSSRGALRQTLLVGGELSRQSTGNQRQTGYFGGAATSRVVSFDAPPSSSPLTFRAAATDANNRATAQVAAAFVQEQLHLGPIVQLVGGARLDHVRIAVDDRRTPSARFARTDAIVTPRVGLVITPQRTWSLYASHSTSALPSAGDQFASLSATTQALVPERFRNQEIGAKWTVSRGLAASTALYRLDRSNSSAPDPTDATKLVQTGRQRTTGVEFNVVGAPHPRWNVIAAVASQRARIVQRTSAAAAGATVPLVPRFTATAWNSLRFMRGGTIGAGVVHQGRRYAAIDNSVALPSFTRLDAALTWDRAGRAPFARALTSVQLRIENLLDRRYFATSQGNNNIMPGAPRLIRLTLSATP